MASVVTTACGDDDPVDPPDMPCASLSTADAITCDQGVCTVPAGNYTGAVNFSASDTYLLDGRVFIGDGTTECAGQLTIPAGTQIQGSSARSGYLAILPNSTINANGTAASPIVFSSDALIPSRGDWGGIIISGNATVNCGGQGTTCNGEGDTGAYGGTNDADNSGTLRYVEIAYGGNRVNATDELNGLALQGVGSGTTIEHIHIHKSDDDGVEFFGGAVNAKWLVITGIGDDSIDWTFGWTGRVQFAVVQQYPDASDNGIEADNNGDNNTATPRSNPILSNLTLVGSAASENSDIGLQLRAGTGGQIWSSVVVDFNDAGLDIDDDETFSNANAAPGNLAVAYSVLCNATNFKNDGGAFTDEAFFLTGTGNATGVAMTNTATVPPCGLGYTAALTSTLTPNFIPTSTSVLMMGGMAPSDTFFEATAYRGAIAPGTVPSAAWYDWADFTL